MNIRDKLRLEQTRELSKWRNEDWCIDDHYSASWCSESDPIIIGGCPRSGSTLLRMLLGSHPDVIDGPETHLFLPLPIDTARLEMRFQMPTGSLERLFNTVTSRGAFIDGFQNFLLTQSGCTRWLEKTSRNVHAFRWIQNRFPLATLIHIIRDPRDVVVSLRTHPRYIRGKTNRIPTTWQHPWNECTDRWKRCVEDGISFRGEPRYLEVKYEALVTEPETTLERICTHAGLRFHLSMLDTKLRHDKVRGVQRSYIINNLEAAAPITQERIGRWNQELPSHILKNLESILYDLMLSTGYISKRVNELS